MGKFLKLFLVGLFFVLISGVANADLITIGEATYGSGKYNLIWDKDNNGKSLVWLDYTDSATKNWDGQRYFVDNLNGTATLTYAFYSGYTVNWEDSIWRLPSAGTVPVQNTEMWDLFNDPERATNFTQLKTGDYDSYFSGTEYDYGTGLYQNAWAFEVKNNRQVIVGKYDYLYGLAVKEATVSTVPEPTTMLLFGLGLLGVAGVSRKKK